MNNNKFHGQILFSVKKHDNQFFFESICEKCRSSFFDVNDTLPENTKREIIKKCGLVLSGEVDSSSLTTALDDGSYFITLIHQYQDSFVFSAVAISFNSGFSHMPCISGLFNMSYNGVFIWHVNKPDKFYLAFANTSYHHQASLPDDALGQTPEKIYSKKKALFIRLHLIKCMTTQQPVTYKQTLGKETYAITLYPELYNGHIILITGTSTNITNYMNKIRQLKHKNKQLMLFGNILQNQIKYEECLAGSMLEFLDAGFSGFSDSIGKLVSNLGGLLDVDWAFAWKSKDAVCGTTLHWLTDSRPVPSDFNQIVQGPDFLIWIGQFQSGRITVVNDMENSPLNVALPIRSFIIVPVLRKEEFWGLLGVFSFRQKRIWATMEISLLKNAADTIIGAYLQAKMEKQLNESNRVLVEYDECLQDMLAVQESLAAATKQYLIARPEGFASCTIDMLEALGELMDIDHAVIHVLNSKQKYAWHRKALPFVSYAQNQDTFIVSRWTGFLKDTKYIAINDIAEETGSLPPFLQDMLLHMGIKSLLIVPIRSGETIHAVMCLSKILGKHIWDNAPIQTAKQFADVFMSAYTRMCEEERLLRASQSNTAIANQVIAPSNLIKRTVE